MSIQELMTYFEEHFFELEPGNPSHPLINPYHHFNPDLDQLNAQKTRRENLHRYLKSLDERPGILVLGEAYGYRGGRFSGIPFSSEAQLANRILPFGGEPTSRNAPPFGEQSATLFWRVMQDYHPHFIAWNCLPFHPHKVDNELSNRTATKSEFIRYEKVLASIYEILQPKLIIAVGRKAQQTLERMQIPASAVRHPAHGGASQFEREIRAQVNLQV